MSVEFIIAETEIFKRAIALPQYGKLYHKIKNYVYPQLRKNPYYGLNVKKLKGDFEGYYRYRLGDYRLFYSIKAGQVVVYILTIKKRSDAYN